MQLQVVGAVCVVAFGAVFAVVATAQQPQSPEVPLVPNAPSPPASPAASWQQSLVAHLGRFQRYPAQARGIEGTVSVAFSIDRHGKVVSSRIAKSSGSPLLDAEALDLIKRAAPLPPPPAEIADGQLSFVVPINFTAH